MQPGEVWLADLGLAAKPRPVVVVSRSDPDPPRALIIYVPLTTQNRQSRYEVVLPKLPFLDRDSMANVQGLGSLPRATRYSSNLTSHALCHPSLSSRVTENAGLTTWANRCAAGGPWLSSAGFGLGFDESRCGA